jgi:ABC-type glycerol-3-phosphate transport system permease component
MSVMSRGFTWRPQSRRRANLINNSLIYGLLLLGAAFALGPFLWTISGSLMTDVEVQAYPPKLWPSEVQWGNYAQVWREVPFGQWILNSLTVVAFSLVGSITSSSVVAYSFARFRYPGREALFMIMLSTMMLPVEVTLIPTYLLFRELKWLDTLKPLIVPSYFGGGAFNIFLMRQFFLTIPRELDEAAFIDGASSWTIFWRLLVPLCKPALATLAVIGFIGDWNAFLQPLIFINTVRRFTVAVGVRFFQLSSIPGVLTKDHLLLAASIMVTAPCLVLFFMAQRYFVQGIVMTGIKG